MTAATITVMAMAMVTSTTRQLSWQILEDRYFGCTQAGSNTQRRRPVLMAEFGLSPSGHTALQSRHATGFGMDSEAVDYLLDAWHRLRA